MQKEQPSPEWGIQYNPNPSTTGLTSVVDPSVLPDVLPPEILRMLERSNLSPENKVQSQSSSRSNGASTSGSSALPPEIQRMLDRSSAPPKETSPPIIPPVDVAQGAKPSPPGSLPPEVLSMLQRSMQPPSPRGTKQAASNNAEKQPQPSPTSQSRAKAPTPKRTPSPPGNPGAGPDPMSDFMAQLSRAQGSQTPQTMRPQSGPREDPLAALLGKISLARRHIKTHSNIHTYQTSVSSLALLVSISLLLVYENDDNSTHPDDVFLTAQKACT